MIVGPTASGKSHLAIAMAQAFQGEIVNCDSVQLYRHLDIGTSKTPVDERHGIPHHLVDVLSPDEICDAADYARMARGVLDQISARGNIPVVAGGTGFYLRALLNGLSEGPGRDTALRERLTRRTPERLHRLLTRFDAATAARIHRNDVQKTIRAIEVCLVSRKPMSELFAAAPLTALSGFRVVKMGLDPDRQALAERINARCVRMFQSGLAEELREILARGFSSDCWALQSIGYREAGLLIAGKLSCDEAITLTQNATRQYAKRQRTWFRREPDVHWIEGFGFDESTIAAARDMLAVSIK